MAGTSSLIQKLRLLARKAATRLAVLIFAVLWNGLAMAEEPFRIGLIAQQGEEAQVEGLASIKAAFSNVLGRPVEVLVARDYSVLAQAQIDGRLDYAAYSATAYAAAQLRCDCLVPVAAPLDADGTPGLYSVLIIRSDGPGARGRLAVGPEDSLTTRLVPLAASVEAQIAATEGRLVEAASAAEAQTLFLQGDIDGFFSWVPAQAEISDGAMTAAPAYCPGFLRLRLTAPNGGLHGNQRCCAMDHMRYAMTFQPFRQSSLPHS